MESINLSELRNRVNNTATRSAWNRGVKDYANDLLDAMEESGETITLSNMQEVALNGACDWSEYAYGGSGLCYNEAIAERLCTPSELKRARGRRGYVGDKANSRETWLDVEARALYQAFAMIENAARKL